MGKQKKLDHDDDCHDQRVAGVNKRKGFKSKASRSISATTVQQDRHMNELLRACLQKVCELQDELNQSQDLEEDAEAAGYAACAMETIRFLAGEGLSAEHPMVANLTKMLVDKNPAT